MSGNEGQKLIENVLKLKKKMIDTGAVIQMYQECQKNLDEKCKILISRDLVIRDKEIENLTLKEQNSGLQLKLSANNSHVEQLKALIAEKEKMGVPVTLYKWLNTNSRSDAEFSELREKYRDLEMKIEKLKKDELRVDPAIEKSLQMRRLEDENNKLKNELQSLKKNLRSDVERDTSSQRDNEKEITRLRDEVKRKKDEISSLKESKSLMIPLVDQLYNFVHGQKSESPTPVTKPVLKEVGKVVKDTVATIVPVVAPVVEKRKVVEEPQVIPMKKTKPSYEIKSSESPKEYIVRILIALMVKPEYNDHFPESIESILNYVLKVSKNDVKSIVEGFAEFLSKSMTNSMVNLIQMVSVAHQLYLKCPFDIFEALYDYLQFTIFKFQDESLYLFGSALSLLSRIPAKKYLFKLDIALNALILDLIKMKTQNYIRIIHCLLEGNPAILKSPEDSILSMAVYHHLSQFTHGKDHDYAWEVFTMTGWKHHASKTSEDIISAIVDMIKSESNVASPDLLLDSTSFEIIHAIDIVAISKPWNWIYSEIIVKNLWGFIKPPSNTQEMRRIAIVFEIITLLGKYGIEERSELGISELRKRFSIVLSEKGQQMFSSQVQRICANGIVELSEMDVKNMSILIPWFDKVKETSQFPLKLSHVYSAMQESKNFVIPNAKRRK